VTQSILILGTSASGSLESSYLRAFQRVGWKTYVWDPITALGRAARGNRFGRLFNTFVHVEPWANKANAELLRVTDELRPDLILAIGTRGLRGGTLAQVKVRLPDVLIYCIYPDSPHNLDSDRIHCLPFFDRVTTSSPAWVPAFQKLGAARVSYLPFAADIDLHRPFSENGQPRIKHDLGFIGTWRPERELFLEQLADFDLCVWGSDYWKHRTRRESPLRSRWGGRSIFGSEFGKVCHETKILLNILDPVTWPGPNMRSFEQSACRAFSLVTRSPAVTEVFKEGEHVECFDSVGEAREKIDFYLRNEKARQQIADRSYDLVVHQGHTYVDRAQQVIKWATEDQKK
jgi:spore maturation protein CgeB